MRVKSGRIHKRWLNQRYQRKFKRQPLKTMVMEMADGTPTVQEGFHVKKSRLFLNSTCNHIELV